MDGCGHLVERPKPKIGPYLERISDILDSDRELPRKQRHTAKRIFERLQQEGYLGGYTQVKEAVRELRRSRGEVVDRGVRKLARYAP